MSQTLKVDITILGGGIAGLWMLSRLSIAGYKTVLLEKHQLGGGQTGYSQGIIHGGTKYALTGKLTGSSESIYEMPNRWRACLEGHGEIDLSAVKLMSDHQYMWSTTSLTSRMAGFFASKLMRSRTEPLDGSSRPELFQNSLFKGQVYKLNEPVLDTASLVEQLFQLHKTQIYKTDHYQIHSEEPNLIQLDDDKTIESKIVILAAGKGNGEILYQLGLEQPQMQLRPLKMIMLRGDVLSNGVYAHCLGASANPRITITSHFDKAGKTVWYVGGEPAEQGVKRSDSEQITVTKKELDALFPWIDFSRCQWATLDIDRAENKMKDGSRPTNAFASRSGMIITTWPTKLALAPALADEVEELVNDIVPSKDQDYPDWAMPELAPLPWQIAENW